MDRAELSEVITWILWICVTGKLICYGNGTLISRPQDVNVVVGTNVVIVCQTDLQSYVRWIHLRETKVEIVYWGSGIITRRYKDRFSVNKIDGWMNLTITSITYLDAGQFICQDYEGEGESASMNLNVFDNQLTCSHNMSSDGIVPADIHCFPGPDYINITCSMFYAGNIAPGFQWTRDGSIEIIHNKTDLNSVNNSTLSRVSSTLLMIANTAMNGSQYTCSICQPSPSSFKVESRHNHSWTSEPLKVLHLLSKHSDIPLNTNQPCPVSTNMPNCSYFRNTSSYLHSEKQSTIHNQSCTTECDVRGGRIICQVSSFVDIEMEESDGFWTKINIFLINFVVTFTILAVVVFIIILINFRKRTHSTKTNCELNKIEKKNENQEDIVRRLLDQVNRVNFQYNPLTRIYLDIPQCEVFGVAELNKNLYILCRRYPAIYCFSSENCFSSLRPFPLLHKIELQNINNPNDMAACLKSSCLYIVCTNGEIYRVNVPGNTVDKMDFIIENPPYTLFVSNDGTLIIPHNRIKSERGMHKDVVAPELLMLTVIENSNRVTTRMIYLPGEWKDESGTPHRVNLHHAIRLQCGKFLVTYGQSYTYVCEVSSSGDFLSSNPAQFAGLSGYLTIQSEMNNDYFVYLTTNETIIKLKSQLKKILIQEEFSQYKLVKREPTRLLLFAQYSFLVGTKHGGAYILTDSMDITINDSDSTVSVSRDTCSTFIKLDVCGQLEIVGVEILNNILYVLCKKSPKIFLYSSKSPFERLDEIQLPHAKDPNDMSACPKNSCLYIICTNGEMYKVDVPLNEVVKMDLIIQSPPYMLSVSKDGTLIVPHNRIKPERGMQKYVVAPELLMLTVINNSNKVSTRMINLPSEWKDKSGIPHRVNLHHAIRLQCGKFLVTYGQSYTYVCEVSISGDFLSSNQAQFDGLSGHFTTVQSEMNNDYFVYLTTNERTIKLNSKLEEITIEEELNKSRLSRNEPARLCCFGQNSFLIGTKHGGAYIITKTMAENSNND